MDASLPYDSQTVFLKFQTRILTRLHTLKNFLPGGIQLGQTVIQTFRQRPLLERGFLRGFPGMLLYGASHIDHHPGPGVKSGHQSQSTG